MDRDEFFAELDQLTPAKIEAMLHTWDMEKLELAREYLTARTQASQQEQRAKPMWRLSSFNLITDRTIAAGLIASSLVLAAMILRGGYEVAASSVGAYVVDRFTGTTWQCFNTCVRLETGVQEKKK